jgi:hypothetical protein
LGAVNFEGVFIGLAKALDALLLHFGVEGG